MQPKNLPDFKKYQGATISVVGKISAHGDKPEITVNSPDQITLKETAPARTKNRPRPRLPRRHLPRLKREALCERSYISLAQREGAMLWMGVH
jgi:hypothetical protein